jgi:PAS domain S-box-containing protein
MQNKIYCYKQFWNYLIENHTGMFYRYSIERGVMISVSGGCKEITGYDTEELINNPDLNFYDLVHPEDKTLTGHPQNTLAWDNTAYKHEYRIIDRWGLTKLVSEVSCFTHDDQQNEIIEGLVVGVTEKKTNREILAMLHAYQISINGGSIVSITDKMGKIIYANDKFCEISGYLRKELIGNNHRILNSRYHDKGFFKTMWSTITSGTPWRGEIKNKSKNGSYYWVDSVITPVLNTQHQIEKYLSIRNVVTRQKEQEEKLRISEEKFRDIVQNTSDLIQSVDPNGTLIFVNETWLSKLGYTQENVIGKSAFLFVHPKSTETYRIILDGLIKHRTFPITVISFITKTGNEIICEANINASYKNGLMTHTRSMLRDITESERSKQELTEKQNLLTNTEKIAKTGSWFQDFTTGKSYWSKGLYRILGITEGTEVNVEKFISYVCDDDRDLLNTFWNNAIKGNQQHTIEFRIKYKHQEKWVRLIIKIKFDLLATAQTAIGFVQDITEKKKYELKLIESRRHLHEAQKIGKIGSYMRNLETDELFGSPELFEIAEIKNNRHTVSFSENLNRVLADDQPGLRSKIIVAQKQNTAFTHQFRYVTRAGNVKYLEVRKNGSPIRRGNSVLSFGTIQDITEIKNLEKKLFNTIIETEEGERERISAELHDGVCQQLAASILLLKLGMKSVNEDNIKTSGTLQDCTKMITDSLHTVRNLSHQLTPRSFKQESLTEALHALFFNLSKIDSSIQYSMRSIGKNKKIDAHVAVNIYRIVQEFVNNSQKHSGAKNINLCLVFAETSFLLTIQDNGKGFDISAIDGKKGIGIMNMIKRVESIGGRYQLNSSASKGVVLKITVPYSK